jgi:hypothetical protein
VQYLKDFNNGDFDVNGCRMLSLQKFHAKYHLDAEDIQSIGCMLEDIKEEKYIEYICLLVGLRNVRAIDNWSECVRNYYQYSMEMNNTWIASKHFLDDYCKIQKEYTIFLDTKKAEKLRENVRNDLVFQYGDYISVVPNTIEQFKDESAQQHNCVYRLYLDTVLDNGCYITFIRNINDLNKSVVTCEIEKDGCIGQFLLKNNDSDIPSDLNIFRMQYQEYLNTLPFYSDDNDDDDDGWEIDNGDGDN